MVPRRGLGGQPGTMERGLAWGRQWACGEGGGRVDRIGFGDELTWRCKRKDRCIRRQLRAAERAGVLPTEVAVVEEREGRWEVPAGHPASGPTLARVDKA